MSAWSTFALSPAEAAAELFEPDGDGKLELDGDIAITFGVRDGGVPAVMVELPGAAIMGIADPRVGGFVGDLGADDGD